MKMTNDTWRWVGSVRDVPRPYADVGLLRLAGRCGHRIWTNGAAEHRSVMDTLLTPFLPNLPQQARYCRYTSPPSPHGNDSPHQPGEVSGRYDPPSCPTCRSRRGTAGTLPLPPPTDDSPHQPGEVSGRYDPLPAQLAAAGEGTARYTSPPSPHGRLTAPAWGSERAL
ncbi:hypothetical protein ACJJTC_001845 [Scirpophaga incertulas]